jgi:hypothetical protein
MQGYKIAGLAVALVASTSAHAATYFATVRGIVTEQSSGWFTDPAVASPIKVGDVITATFRYTANMSVGEGLAGRFAMFGMNQTRFTLGGFTWTSADDHLAGVFAPSFQPGVNPLTGFVSIMEGSSKGGDLRVRDLEFDIGEFGYGFYQGPAFRGTFDPASFSQTEEPAAFSPVPELTLWSQLIAGFGVIGAVLRERRRRRAKWQDMVARLSGRVREQA